jgi:hypothetical protein
LAQETEGEEMSKREFLKQNRKAIDAAIRRKLNDENYQLNDRERELWLLNDEGLYNWARSEGVKL